MINSAHNTEKRLHGLHVKRSLGDLRRPSRLVASHNFCSRSEGRCSQSKLDELARKTDLDCRVVCGSGENEEEGE